MQTDRRSQTLPLSLSVFVALSLFVCVRSLVPVFFVVVGVCVLNGVFACVCLSFLGHMFIIHPKEDLNPLI